jgi:hypothetical protein
MRILLLLLIVPFVGLGQAELNWLNNDPEREFSRDASLEFHSAIRPWLAPTNTVSIDSSESQNEFLLSAFPLADVGLFSFPDFQLRTMAGGGFALNGSKWYGRASYLHGIEKQNGFYPSKGFYTKNHQYNNEVADFRGLVSFRPNKILNLQLGYDEIFIGEGSRTLFLGDYGQPYAFGAMRLNFWRFEYMNIYQFFNENTSSGKVRKYGTSHYLSTSLADWLQIGVFESVVFHSKDTLLNRGYEPEYLNPMIFYRPQEYALGSVDNVLVGIDGTIKVNKNLTIYGQVIIDEFSLMEIRKKTGWWANKFGLLAGIKGLIRMKEEESLFLRGEMNFVKPYTYSHLTPAQSYSHHGDVLAHPYGANFAEILTQITYTNKKLRIDSYFSYSVQGFSGDSLNQGEDILRPYINRPSDYGVGLAQGFRNHALRHQLRVSYEPFKKSKMNVFIEIHNRLNTYIYEPQFQLIIGLRHNLWNDYRNY